MIATHSDQALALLHDASDRERELLGAIPYQANQAVLHTDVSMLPRRRRAWASWNYHLLDEPGDRTTVTYHMNRLQSLRAEREFCVTLNRTAEIDPDAVIRTIDYSHPVYTAAGVAAQRRVREISGRQTHPLLRRLLGVGLPRGRGRLRPAGRHPLRSPAVTTSCLYVGTIRHRRAAPRSEFRHRLALTYVDLAELPTLLDGRLLRRGPGLLRFRRRDYLGDPAVALDVAVRDRVAQLTGARPRGPIRMLTQLRSFGLCFNPITFYYCLDEAGERLQAVLAEVTNTPWGERHSYVLDEPREDSPVIRGTFAKALHVSPFQPMDHVYRARATAPGATASVHIDSEHDGRIVFDATLGLARRELDRAGILRMAARYPLATARVLALIYGHALGLKLAGARYHPHPTAVA